MLETFFENTNSVYWKGALGTELYSWFLNNVGIKSQIHI